MNMLQKLEMLMKMKGIENRRQLSQKSGIAYTTLDGLWKKGYENIKLQTLQRLSIYFGVTMEYLTDDNIEEIQPIIEIKIKEIPDVVLGVAQELVSQGLSKDDLNELVLLVKKIKGK